MPLCRTVRSQIPRPVLPTVLLLWTTGTAVGTFVLCPYCDPNYNAYPNLEVSLAGNYTGNGVLVSYEYRGRIFGRNWDKSL
jgi:hypothetical protein